MEEWGKLTWASGLDLGKGREVAGEHLGTRAFDRDGHELRLQARPGRRPNPGPVTPPPGEVVLQGGAVGPQVAPCDLDQGRVRGHGAPGAEPFLRPHNGHADR